jgi:hypothetical protein
LILTPLDHEHTNNDNVTNNWPMKHHFKAGHPKRINKHINFIGWPFNPSYESFDQSHGGNEIGPIGEPKYKH